MTVLWNDTTNHMKLKESTEQHHLQHNTNMLADRVKITEIVTVHRIVENNTKELINTKLSMSKMLVK